MVLFAFIALFVVMVLLLVRSVARVANQDCRYRCTCVADSAALGALAAIVESPPIGHDR